MRENMGLYRGKRNDNGEWVFGALYKKTHFYGDPCAEWYIITSTESLVYDQALEYHEVDPETVGQFTGLTDKNGKKIFEGDIIRVLGDQASMDWKNVDYIGSVAFIDTGFCIIDGTIEEHGFRRYGMHRMDFTLEVIGNIHDNPELLREEVEK